MLPWMFAARLRAVDRLRLGAGQLGGGIAAEAGNRGRPSAVQLEVASFTAARSGVSLDQLRRVAIGAFRADWTARRRRWLVPGLSIRLLSSHPSFPATPAIVHGDVFGDLSAVFDRPAADADVADDEALAAAGTLYSRRRIWPGEPRTMRQ